MAGLVSQPVAERGPVGGRLAWWVGVESRCCPVVCAGMRCQGKQVDAVDQPSAGAACFPPPVRALAVETSKELEIGLGWTRRRFIQILPVSGCCLSG